MGAFAKRRMVGFYFFAFPKTKKAIGRQKIRTMPIKKANGAGRVESK